MPLHTAVMLFAASPSFITGYTGITFCTNLLWANRATANGRDFLQHVVETNEPSRVLISGTFEAVLHSYSSWPVVRVTTMSTFRVARERILTFLKHWLDFFVATTTGDVLLNML